MISHQAVLTQALPGAAHEFRILPPGVFRAKDGRPANLPGWKIDAAIAQRVIAASASVDEMVIDYEHQTINSEKNGQPAPAAGWFSRMVWREGAGLFAVGVQWTAKAKAMIAAGEYRHISPVFPYSAVTGEVLKIISLGLTNNPALPGLANLTTLSAQRADPARVLASARDIEIFNRAFGQFGQFHPDTPAETISALTQPPAKPRFPADLAKTDPRAADALRRMAPDAWQD